MSQRRCGLRAVVAVAVLVVLLTGLSGTVAASDDLQVDDVEVVDGQTGEAVDDVAAGGEYTLSVEVVNTKAENVTATVRASTDRETTSETTDIRMHNSDTVRVPLRAPPKQGMQTVEIALWDRTEDSAPSVATVEEIAVDALRDDPTVHVQPLVSAQTVPTGESAIVPVEAYNQGADPVETNVDVTVDGDTQPLKTIAADLDGGESTLETVEVDVPADGQTVEIDADAADRPGANTTATAQIHATDRPVTAFINSYDAAAGELTVTATNHANTTHDVLLDLSRHPGPGEPQGEAESPSVVLPPEETETLTAEVHEADIGHGEWSVAAYLSDGGYAETVDHRVHDVALTAGLETAPDIDTGETSSEAEISAPDEAEGGDNGNGNDTDDSDGISVALLGAVLVVSVAGVGASFAIGRRLF